MLPEHSDFFVTPALLAVVVMAVAAGWMIQPDSMRADAPRLQEVRSIPPAESTLGSLSGPQGKTIVVLPGNPDPRFRLLDEAGREVATVQDSSILETDHGFPDPGRLLADVPTWTDRD